MRRAAAALAAAALLAGCGSTDTKAENRYVDAVNATQGRLTKTLDTLSGRISASTTPDQDRRALAAFDTALSGAVAKLRRIEPPSKVTALHRELIGELDGYQREVSKETAALRSGDPAALVAAQRRLLAVTNETASRVNTTIDRINTRLGS